LHPGERSDRAYGRYRGLAPSPEAVRPGFTLVELLVVIAIIGLLAALLLPSLAESRDRARGAVCESNLHQLVSAAHIYAKNHRDMMPVNLGYWFRKPAPYVADWHGVLLANDYLDEAGVLICPSSSLVPGDDNYCVWLWENDVVSYTVPQQSHSRRTWEDAMGPLGRVRSDTKLWLIESRIDWLDYWFEPELWPTDKWDDNAWHDHHRVMYRHAGFTYGVFRDGHTGRWSWPEIEHFPTRVSLIYPPSDMP